MENAEQTFDNIRHNILAAAVLHEAGRIASLRGNNSVSMGDGPYILPGDVQKATDALMQVLTSLKSKNL